MVCGTKFFKSFSLDSVKLFLFSVMLLCSLTFSFSVNNEV